MTMLENAYANLMTLVWYAMLAGSVAFGWTATRIAVSTTVSTVNIALYNRRVDARLAEQADEAGELEAMKQAAVDPATGHYL